MFDLNTQPLPTFSPSFNAAVRGRITEALRHFGEQRIPIVHFGIVSRDADILDIERQFGARVLELLGWPKPNPADDPSVFTSLRRGDGFTEVTLCDVEAPAVHVLFVEDTQDAYVELLLEDAKRRAEHADFRGA